MQVPTKAELKVKYQITNDDFQVLTQDTIPDASLLQRLGQWIEPVAQCFGVPTFLIKSRYGLVVSVVLIPVWGPSAIERFQNVKSMTVSAYQDMVKSLGKAQLPQAQTYKYAIVTGDHILQSSDQLDLSRGIFPMPSGLYQIASNT